MDAASRARKVVGSLLTGNLFTILVQVASVPVLLYGWGVAGYADWIILSTIPGFLVFTDLGITTIANNKIDGACEKKDYAAAHEVLGTSLFVITVAVATIAALGLIFHFCTANASQILHTIDNNKAKLIAVVLAADTFLSIYHNHLSAIFRTANRLNESINWQTLSKVVVSVALLVSVGVFNVTLLEAAMLSLIVRLGVLGAMIPRIFRKCAWVCLRKLNPSLREARAMSGPTSSFLLLPISNAITLQATTLLVAATSSPQAVLQYSTLRTLTRFIPQFTSIPAKAQWSELTKSHAIKDHAKIIRILQIIVKHTAWSLLAVVAAYSVMGEYVFTLWTSKRIEFSSSLYALLMFQAVMIAFYTSLEVYPLATNQIRQYSISFFVGTLIQFSVAYFVLVGFPSCSATHTVALTGAIFSGSIAILLYKKYYFGWKIA